MKAHCLSASIRTALFSSFDTLISPLFLPHSDLARFYDIYRNTTNPFCFVSPRDHVSEFHSFILLLEIIAGLPHNRYNYKLPRLLSFLPFFWRDEIHVKADLLASKIKASLYSRIPDIYLANNYRTTMKLRGSLYVGDVFSVCKKAEFSWHRIFCQNC